MTRTWSPANAKWRSARLQGIFVNGSTDIVDAESVADAREKAAKQFGRVQRVEIIDEGYYDGPEDTEHRYWRLGLLCLMIVKIVIND